MAKTPDFSIQFGVTVWFLEDLCPLRTIPAQWPVPFSKLWPTKNCLPRRRPKDNFDFDGREVEKDPGCEIVAALLPLCQSQLTNVDWIILNGIELGETDLDYLIPAMQKSQAKLRAIECSHCGLNDRGIMQLNSMLL